MSAGALQAPLRADAPRALPASIIAHQIPPARPHPRRCPSRAHAAKGDSLSGSQHSYTVPSGAGGPAVEENMAEEEGEEAAVGFGMRKTKMVCTIGPATSDRENLFALADAGMNVARINMSHGSHESHREVVELIKEYNALGRNGVAVMLDTKGPEVRSGDLEVPINMETGDVFWFTIKEGAKGQDKRISVNYDGFIDDVEIGDTLLVDGGLLSFLVREKTDTEVKVEVVDSGVMASRRHLNVRGKSANLPSITEKDWLDLEFGVEVGVDFYALSFVKDARVIIDLKRWLAQRGAKIGVLAKIESAESIDNLASILDAVDGAMVARGDLGAELAFESVPYWQSNIIQGCRRRGKPVIVATNMLESMIKQPTPTRAEVSDISIAVREGADAVMLSGETAYGKFPFKSVSIMDAVCRRTEKAMRSYTGSRRFGSTEAAPIDWVISSHRHGVKEMTTPYLSEMFAYHATTMANTVKTTLIVFTRKGNMPALLSHYRPDYPIFAFCEDEAVQRRLAVYHGVTSIRMRFEATADASFERALEELRLRGHVSPGQQVAIVQSGRKPIWRTASTHTIQVRRVEAAPGDMEEEEDVVDLQKYLTSK
ncbi:unnamed protein product [Ostreobium quekettii]|uniref:Pyruvate kinase n=1 Tax=Ostreobium quekettii TaxID=121088 RepID=A0A8S1J8S3_9CHLO|nr:unnamed protein product [Ostreobium quekettii]|eukprot:evm.model.scf_18.31 EVM.evm.TU.scf_18.31   scf_18:215009-218685(+)